MRSQRLTLRLSAQLIQRVDEVAAANYSSRSDFIREAVVMRLNNQQMTNKPRMDDILELLKHVKPD